jgi:hypothetical protein
VIGTRETRGRARAKHSTVAREGVRAVKRTTVLGSALPWDAFDVSYDCRIVA